MSPRKLSESDKQQILELYRLPGETTSTLASRYGVSNSTISRILKSSFSETEYEVLIQQKRGGARASEDLPEEAPPLVVLQPPVAEEQLEMPLVQPEPAQSDSRRRLRKRSSAAEPVNEPPPLVEAEEPAALEFAEPAPPVVLMEEALGGLNGDYTPEPAEIQEILNEELLDQDDLSDLDEDEELDDEEELDDDFEEGDLAQQPLLVARKTAGRLLVQVLPFTEAQIPKTCYLVVDRAAELIARPLREFGDLGQIPEDEIQAKTLPIFDNHRVAKRFSNPRTQRVIKLPDGRVLQKTSSHLQAKGITRLLIDGQVYSL